MRKSLYILTLLIVSFMIICCNGNVKHKWNDGYDPKYPECFDTVICENGDSLLIINMAIDTIL